MSNRPLLTNKFSGLFRAVLVTVLSRHWTVDMTANAPIAQTCTHTVHFVYGVSEQRVKLILSI